MTKAKIIPIFKARAGKNKIITVRLLFYVALIKYLKKLSSPLLQNSLNEKKNKLKSHQISFRRRIPTENAVQNLPNQVFHAFDNGELI